MIWDADKYAADFSFVPRYGRGVIELIEAEPGATVLDLGCGNGALTRELREKGYAVTGLDASESLLALARAQDPATEYVPGDATAFALPAPVDVVFSNAVFHWIRREQQADMLRCVHRALRENGQFVFEFGGRGNNRAIHSALQAVFAEHGYGYELPFYFPGLGEYAALVEEVGFRVVYAVLFDRPTELRGEDGLREWIRMFVKAPFAAVPTEEERESLMLETQERLRDQLYRGGKWYADYVRLRMKAVRC